METMDRYYLVEFGENQVQKFPAHEVEDAFKFALRKRESRQFAPMWFGLPLRDVTKKTWDTNMTPEQKQFNFDMLSTIFLMFLGCLFYSLGSGFFLLGILTNILQVLNVFRMLKKDKERTKNIL